MTNRDRALIDDIMDGFDFARVRRCMEALNWRWLIPSGGEDPNEPPSENRLRRTARKYLTDTITEYETAKAQEPETFGMTTGSGGFRAYYRAFREHPPTLRLSFEVDFYEAGEDEEADGDELYDKGEKQEGETRH